MLNGQQALILGRLGFCGPDCFVKTKQGGIPDTRPSLARIWPALLLGFGGHLQTYDEIILYSEDCFACLVHATLW